MNSHKFSLVLLLTCCLCAPDVIADEIDLRRNGAFGFPQPRAQLLCDGEDVRVSAVSNGEYLFVQAIVWKDHSDEAGELNGRKYNDYSNLWIDVDGDGQRTRLIDRSYDLNYPNWPGLSTSVNMTATGAVAGRSQSLGRGMMEYVDVADGRKVRVDSFLIPLSELGNKLGDQLRLAYWTRSPQPEFIANSVGFESDKPYFATTLPQERFHELKLVDGGAIDISALPIHTESEEGAATAAPTIVEPTLTIGSPAPSLDIEHWVQNGQGKFEPVTQFASGKVYIVEFWATWCGPCIAAMPHIADLQKTHADKGLQVVSISDETLDIVEKFLDRKVPERNDDPAAEGTPITYRELTNAYCLTTDPDRSNHDAYMKAAGQNGIPTAFIVGKDGHIEWIGHPMSIDKALVGVLEGNWDRAEFLAEFKESGEFSRRARAIMDLAYGGKFDAAREAITDAREVASSETIKQRATALLRTVGRVEVEKHILLNSDAAAAKLTAFLDGQSPEEVNNVVWYNVVTVKEKGRNIRMEILASAKQLTERAVQEAPEYPHLLDTHAHLLQLTGDLDRAIEFQEKAVKLADEKIRQNLEKYLEQLRNLRDPNSADKSEL